MKRAQETAQRPPGPTTLLLGLLSVAGLSFWFVLGFPFANHNESFLWAVRLPRFTLLDTLTKATVPVANFRPLGVATAWLGYRLSGGSTAPQQVLNFLGAAAAWLLLFGAAREKRAFACVALVAGGAFFSGYVYLFHLHGVFYSPLLVFLAVLTVRPASDRILRPASLVALALLAALTALCHPFALLLFAAFVLGALLQTRRAATRARRALALLGVAGALVLARLLAPDSSLPEPSRIARGLLASYRMTELHPALSAVAWLLAVAALSGAPASRGTRLALAAAATALSAGLAALRWPVLLVWVAAALVKAAATKRWPLALLIATSALFPAFSATGSPTYVVFVLMASSFTTALGAAWLEGAAPLGTRAAAAALGVVLVAAVLVRAGAPVPVVSRLALPLLAEREKTIQMERIVAWHLSSEYRDRRLVLRDAPDIPASARNAAERALRPPTYQIYLDAYVDALRSRGPDPGAGDLLVTFGGAAVEGAERLYSVAGRRAGDAAVWRTGG